MAATVFDDPNYIPIELNDWSYDSPSPFLDRVPNPRRLDEASQTRAQLHPSTEQNDDHPSLGQGSGNSVEDSGGYATVDDFLEDADVGQNGGDEREGSFWEGDSEEEEYGEEEGEGEGEGEGERVRKKSNRFSKVHQSRSNLENFEGSTRIYVEGEIIPLQPMLSFRSRVRARSREELEEDGIYQGLRITDEQKQQIGIMPESIYMTVALETSRAVLENMTMEIGQHPSRQGSGVSQRRSSVTPSYRGLILHPPPLPPLNPGTPTTERKCHAIMENIVKSEAAFLTSLKVAEQVYMKPLLEMASPPIDREQVRILFGPIEELMGHHELFYSALTQRTMEWGPKQTVGNVFMTFYRREVIGHYVQYVNNFTDAMATLQRNIKKNKQKFVIFLEQRYRESKTSLSLQGLLLKPVQRFPQYILFLQDLIKYTPPHHPDRVTLQLALARCETIAEHLNEAKRTKEQQTIVTHLSSRVTDLPFKLHDSPNRCLLLQELVTRLMLSPQGSKNLVQHKRSLLLFNNMAMCASMSQPHKKPNGAGEVGLFEDARYKCKWQSPLDKLSVMEPDYANDIWDNLVTQDDSEEATAYKKLKSEYMKYTRDFETLGRIASLVSALEDNYTGLKVASMQSHMRVLQRKIARAREELRRNQPGRLDLQIPSRDESLMVHHTYVFESEKSKQNFLNNLRYATLKLKEENQMAWVCSENAEDDDVILDSVGHLPLFVENYHLTNNSESLSTECATKTHGNQVWFASCSIHTAEIAIIQSLTPKPILLKSFRVDSTRILAMCYAPRDTTGHQSSPPLSSMSAIIGAPSLSPQTETIWMGSQTGKLMIHPTSNEMAHKCIEVINFAGPITCIEYYKNQVFIAVEGNIYIYNRPKDSIWDLDNPVVLKVHDGVEPITCMCQVQQKLWIGAGNRCYVFNTGPCRLEGHFLVSQAPMAVVRNMTSAGSGVWISLRRSSTVQLFHTVTKSLLQEIDIEKAFHHIATKHNIGSKLQGVKTLHITSLLLCKGYLWIGTSTGAIMVYRTPYLKTVPVTTGKPYMALHGHSSGVRVLISSQTAGTLSSSRFDQFVSEEQERFQEEWEPVEPEESQVQPQLNGDDAVYGGGEVESASWPMEGGEDSSTFPPLPPPNFDDLSPNGTLKSVRTEADGDGGAGDHSRSSTLKAQSEANTHRENSGESNEVPTTTAAEGAAAVSSEPPPTSEGIAMPVRRKSSSKKTRGGREQEREGRDTNVISEVEDTGTFRRLSTLEAAGKGRPSPVDEEEATPPAQPALELTPPPLYDEVTPDDSPNPARKRSPSPYEDPSTLHLTGPIPLHPMPDFFTTLEQSVAPSFSGRCTEGAIYVLTGGRGFVSLQSGRRRSLQYIRPGDVSTADESCIIAYELKH